MAYSLFKESLWQNYQKLMNEPDVQQNQLAAFIIPVVNNLKSKLQLINLFRMIRMLAVSSFFVLVGLVLLILGIVSFADSTLNLNLIGQVILIVLGVIIIVFFVPLAIIYTLQYRKFKVFKSYLSEIVSNFEKNNRLIYAPCFKVMVSWMAKSDKKHERNSSDASTSHFAKKVNNDVAINDGSFELIDWEEIFNMYNDFHVNN